MAEKNEVVNEANEENNENDSKKEISEEKDENTNVNDVKNENFIDNEKNKARLKKVNKDLKKGTSEFKQFIMRGNVVDLAVGVVVGGAFSKIVSSLVNDILMPLIGILIGGIDFSNLSITVLNAKVQYGMFIQQVIDFLIISLCVFLFVKFFNKLSRNDKKEEEKEKKEEKSNEEKLLEEIRDLLKEKNKK